MKNNKGFSLPVVALVVIILGLVGVTGWLIYDRQNSSKGPNGNTVDSGQNGDSSTNEPDETNDWLTFSPDSQFYSIKLPDGWTFLHQNDECDCLYSESTEYKVGTPAIISKTQGGRDGITGYFITVYDRDMTGEFSEGYQKVGTFKTAGLEGVKYYYEQTTEPDGIGLEKGGKEYIYLFKKEGKTIYVLYSLNPGTPNNLETVEKSIKTLK